MPCFQYGCRVPWSLLKYRRRHVLAVGAPTIARGVKPPVVLVVVCHLKLMPSGIVVPNPPREVPDAVLVLSLVLSMRSAPTRAVAA